MGRWDARKLKWKEAREGQDGLHDAVPESALQFAVAAIAWRRVKERGLLLLLSVSHASNPKQCDSPDAMLPVPVTVPSSSLPTRMIIRGEARQGGRQGVCSR